MEEYECNKIFLMHSQQILPVDSYDLWAEEMIHAKLARHAGEMPIPLINRYSPPIPISSNEYVHNRYVGILRKLSRYDRERYLPIELRDKKVGELRKLAKECNITLKKQKRSQLIDELYDYYGPCER